MTNPRDFTYALFASLLLTVPVASIGAVITADHADDVCSPTADPCTVTDTVAVVSGSTLDFGTRKLHLTSGGHLDFDTGSATVLCGDFTADPRVAGPVITVRGSVSGTYVGGQAVIAARGKCSGDSTVACLTDTDCIKASAGSCTDASGTMVINDDVVGVGNPAGIASFTAYKSFTSTQLINLSNGGQNSSEVPGGSLSIDTKTGSVSIEANLNVNGGSEAEGGSIVISSGEDVSISGNLLLNGGNEGGGSLEIDADRDVLVQGDIDAATASSDSVGGEIYIQAQRDIVFTAPGSFNQTVIDTKGHSANGLPGSGGSQVFTAGRTLSVGSYVVLKSKGPVGEGDGGTIELHACTLTVAANATLEADGPYGGAIELSGLHVLEVDQGATVDASGSEEDGSILLLTRSFVRCEAGSHNACQVNADCDICTSGTCEPPRVCSNSPITQCTVDSDCTSGCGSGTCMEGACTNEPEVTCDVDSDCENIGCQSDDCLNALQVGDESQFDPAAEKRENPRLSDCL